MEKLEVLSPSAGSDPPYLFEEYRSTKLRAPSRVLLLPQPLRDVPGPAFGEDAIGQLDHDLTCRHASRPQGQLIIVSGQVRDASGRPLADSLVEIWQANASGRYRHESDRHEAPLDPNFDGAGRCLTDSEGRYRFVTIKPGAYPWQNHLNAWRPAHIHFSLFGRSFSERLVTQMYFPDDSLLPYDPVISSIRDPRDRARLISSFDVETTVPDRALGFRWDIVLGGAAPTPFEGADHE